MAREFANSMMESGMLMDRRRFRFLLYMTMALMDCVSGIFIFIGPVRAALLGGDPLVAGSMVTARAVCCFLATLVVSRFLNSRNSMRLLFAANALYFGAALLGLWANSIGMLFLTSALAGVFMSIFSASFQLFMKDVDSPGKRPLSQVVGTYTFAWCFGMSFGPFITGGLMELGKPADGVGLSVGWIYAYLTAAGMIFITFVTLLWLRKVSADHMRRHLAAQSDRVDVSEGRGKPDLAWLGWIMAIVGSTVLGVVRAVFPAGTTLAGMPEWQSGLAMTLVSLAMAFFAYAVSLGHTWMYSGRRMLLFGGIGVGGMFLYVLPRVMGWGLLDHVGQFYVAALMAGGYSGVVYLYSGFHSLVHPEKAGRNIALNEAFLSVGMTGGTLGGGWLAKHFGFYPPFVVAACLVLLLALTQYVAHRRHEQG